MSIKPSVVYIKGVHSTTSSDQTSDIGFPNIGLDKLFEGAILKVNYYYSGAYDSLQFVFTDKTIPDVLKACGLPNNLGLEKYMHLTNLEYNKN